MKTEEIIKIFTTPLRMFSFLFYSQSKQFVYNKVVIIVVPYDNTSKIQRANDPRLFTSRAVHLFTFPSHAQARCTRWENNGHNTSFASLPHFSRYSAPIIKRYRSQELWVRATWPEGSVPWLRQQQTDGQTGWVQVNVACAALITLLERLRLKYWAVYTAAPCVCLSLSTRGSCVRDRGLRRQHTFWGWFSNQFLSSWVGKRTNTYFAQTKCLNTFQFTILRFYR